MKTKLLRRILRIGLPSLLAALYGLAEEHKWAGRALDDIEWAVHEKLAALPFHGVFDTLNFEVQGRTVVLTGQVLTEKVKQHAERVTAQAMGVESVVNRIEVLPASPRDEALRMKVYRAIYETRPLEKYGTRSSPPIHIIVKNGWVTLEGVVDSEADRSLVHLRALKVSSHVSDHLRVALEE